MEEGALKESQPMEILVGSMLMDLIIAGGITHYWSRRPKYDFSYSGGTVIEFDEEH